MGPCVALGQDAVNDSIPTGLYTHDLAKHGAGLGNILRGVPSVLMKERAC